MPDRALAFSIPQPRRTGPQSKDRPDGHSRTPEALAAERPALPRILLREIADSSSPTRPALLVQIPPFVQMVESVARVVENTQSDLMPSEMESLHVASAIAGATLFFEIAIPALLPHLELDLSRDELVAEHQRQILRMTRLLLQRQAATDAGPEGGRAQPHPDEEKEADDA